MSSSVLITIIGGWFCVVGIGLYIFALFRILEGKASLNWPTVEGQVVETGVATLHRSTSSRKSIRQYLPRVRYRYQVAGQLFEGERLWTIQSTERSEAAAEEIVSRYNEGQTVTVHYNPRQIERAVLIPGTRRVDFTFMVVGLVLTCIGAVVVVLVI